MSQEPSDLQDGPIATASLRDAAPEYLPLSENATEGIERHQHLLAGLELQKRKREIVVPTSDALVKARLIELEEPIILFGEGKPERRERHAKAIFEADFAGCDKSWRREGSPRQCPQP
jgi:hypothetical protein